MKKLLGNTIAKIIAIILAAFSGSAALMASMYYSYRYFNGELVNDFTSSWIVNIARTFHSILLPVAIGCGLLAVALLVFLVLAAGRHNEEPRQRLNALDKLPLDLFLICGGLLIALLLSAMWDALYYGYLSALATMIPLGLLSALLGLAMIMSLASRIKMGGWWKNSITYHIVLWLLKIGGKLWGVFRDILNNLPILWKFLLGFCLYVLVFTLCLIGSISGGGGLLAFLLLNVAALLLLCSAALQMNRLQNCGQKLALGQLNFHLDTKKMFPDFRKHGENLNSISAGMAAAVEERMKSERLKTELITNVSHDLKTPLTSIINYVDLLQKEQIDNEEARGYIDVLARQSARLRKLTEDLIEVSKASTGNVSVNLELTNVTELLHQCMGEYEERFHAAGLTPLIIAPEEAPYIMGDGRLLWRVFDNLLNNICKYSQPDTRVYCDIAQTDDQVRVSLKNVSRDVLNISTAELRERFVRGDGSRGSEGSGLGLAIASSLTELQSGRFSLHVDGDLFKAIIIFDRLPAPSNTVH